MKCVVDGCTSRAEGKPIFGVVDGCILLLNVCSWHRGELLYPRLKHFKASLFHANATPAFGSV